MAKNFYKYIYSELSRANIANGNIFVSDTTGSENHRIAPYIFVTEISEKIFPNSVRSTRFQFDIFWKNMEQTIEIRQEIIKIFHKKIGEISSEMIETHGIVGAWENLIRASLDFRFIAKDSKY